MVLVYFTKMPLVLFDAFQILCRVCTTEYGRNILRGC